MEAAGVSGVVAHGAREGNSVALTFDDGPGRSTEEILTLLEQHDAHATFFMVGSRRERFPHMARRVVAAGHEVGSHTFSHLDHQAVAPHEAVADMVAGAEAIAGVLGFEPRLYRAPYGHFVPETTAEAERRDWTCVLLERPGLRLGGEATPRSVADRVLADLGAGRDRAAARCPPREADGPRAGHGCDRDPARRDRAPRLARRGRGRHPVSAMERPRLLLVPELTELEWVIKPLLEEWAEVASYDAPGVGDEPAGGAVRLEGGCASAASRSSIGEAGIVSSWSPTSSAWPARPTCWRWLPTRFRRWPWGTPALSNALDGEQAALNREVYAGLGP